jgi:hypothetical protein
VFGDLLGGAGKLAVADLGQVLPSGSGAGVRRVLIRRVVQPRGKDPRRQLSGGTTDPVLARGRVRGGPQPAERGTFARLSKFFTHILRERRLRDRRSLLKNLGIHVR